MAIIQAKRTVTLKGEDLDLADLKEVVHKAVLLGLPDNSKIRFLAGLGLTLSAPLDPPEEIPGLSETATLGESVRALAEHLGLDKDTVSEAVASALGVEYVDKPEDRGDTPTPARTEHPEDRWATPPRSMADVVAAHDAYRAAYKDQATYRAHRLPPDAPPAEGIVSTPPATATDIIHGTESPGAQEKASACPWCGSTDPRVRNYLHGANKPMCGHLFHSTVTP